MKHLLDTKVTCGDCYFFLDCDDPGEPSNSHICLRYPPVFVGFKNCKEKCSKEFICPCFHAFSHAEVDGAVICGEFKPKKRK